MRTVLALIMLATPASAESLIALRTIPARTVLMAADMTAVDARIDGAVTDPLTVAGQEARVTVFAGQPILAVNFAAPALVDRNQIVTLIYAQGTLQIVTEGRALGRAGAGEMVRVMNLGSRATVTGIVTGTGAVSVGPDLQKD
jgi:flagellar basal body P-ring formation protein FlgA